MKREWFLNWGLHIIVITLKTPNPKSTEIIKHIKIYRKFSSRRKWNSFLWQPKYKYVWIPSHCCYTWMSCIMVEIPEHGHGQCSTHLSFSTTQTHDYNLHLCSYHMQVYCFFFTWHVQFSNPFKILQKHFCNVSIFPFEYSQCYLVK